MPARVHRALALAFCSSQRWPRCPSHGLSHTLGPWIDGGEGKIKSRPGEGRFWSWIIPPKIGIPQDYIRLPSLSLSIVDIGQIMIHEITWRNDDKCPELGGMAFSHKPRSWQQAPLLLPHTHTAFRKTSCSTTVILLKSNYSIRYSRTWLKNNNNNHYDNHSNHHNNHHNHNHNHPGSNNMK